MQAGSGQLAHMVLEAPTRAPMQIFGVTFLIAMMLSQFVEHGGWNVAVFVEAATRHAVRRALGSSNRAVRSIPDMAKCAYVAVTVCTAVYILSVAMKGADASPTVARVQRVRTALDAAPLSPALRNAINQHCVAH